MCSKQGLNVSVCKLNSNNAPKELVQEHHYEHGNDKQLDRYVEIHGQQNNQSNSNLQTEKREGKIASETERGMQMTHENEREDVLPQMNKIILGSNLSSKCRAGA